jgi:flagellin
MPFSTGANARIRTNSASELAYNALALANRDISLQQLRLSTGKRINNASDDVAGFITSRALQARNGLLKASLNIVGDARNVTNIALDAYDNISTMIVNIRESTASASSGAQGTSEKVALAKSAYRFIQQIQTIVDSTVFGGRQIIDGAYSSNFIVGTDAVNTLLSIAIDLNPDNVDFDIENDFKVNSMSETNFAGIQGLDLREFNDVNATDLGIFSDENMGTTLKSLANALDNVTKVSAYIGGITNRLISQEEILQQQVVNYNAAISRIEDTDVAKAQLSMVKSQFLQQASITSLAQSNQNPNVFLQLIRQ